jgi:hypothetical protein
MPLVPCFAASWWFSTGATDAAFCHLLDIALLLWDRGMAYPGSWRRRMANSAYL